MMRLSSIHSGRWLITGLLGLLFLGLANDFIANERPIAVRYEGRLFWPIFRSYGQSLGLYSHHPVMDVRNIDHKEYAMWRPPVVYGCRTIDNRHANYVGPFDEQQVPWRERHWLGTDQLGRDTLAGLLAGLRIAWWVGLGAVLMSALIGLGLGVMAGYFGNRYWTVGIADIVVFLMLLLASVYFWSIFLPWRASLFGSTNFGFMLFLWVISVGLIIYVWQKVSPRVLRPWFLPADNIILRLIEWFKAIPGVFLVLAVMGLVTKPSVGTLILIIGLTSWPAMAQYTRAELMKIKNEPFVESVLVLGLSHRRILGVHILPVILGPLAITWAFAFSNAVLIESALSFLGLGLPLDQVTWGSQLNEARQHIRAWWLALFPGLGIFLIVYGFNRLGDAILLALQPKKGLKPL